MADLFFEAARQKIKFETAKGVLSTEDLFDLPLRSHTERANLDTIAMKLNKQLEDAGTKSFVDETVAGNEETKLKFDIVLCVINFKKAENKAKLERKENAEKKQQLLSLIANKENEKLADMDLDDLRKMVEKLG